MGNNRDGVCAVETFDRFLHGFKQPAAVLRVFVVDAVCDDFGIRLRFKPVSQTFQAFAFAFKVFDDAVVDDGNHTAADVRVGVRLGNAAVCRPARMPDADAAADAFFACRVLHKLHASDAAHALDFAV